MVTRTPMHPLKILAAVGVAFLLWGLVLAYDSSPAHAATITVTTNEDESNTDGDCSLREAIQASETNQAVDGCTAGSATEEDAIHFALGTEATIVLGSQLPSIRDASGLTIDGQEAKITVSGNNQVRVFLLSRTKLTLAHLTVADGFAPNSVGGAVSNNQGTIEASNSTFSGNRATQGGAIHSFGNLVEVSNSTFSGNSAGSGGGIYTDAGTLNVTNSTFSGNSSGITTDGTATLKNTILANNPGGNCRNFGTLTDGGYNLENGTSCGFSATNNSQPSTDPLLDPDGLSDNGGPTKTIALQAGSPAIDQGKSFGATTDQRGQNRPRDYPGVQSATGGDGSDIGAFEVQEVFNTAPQAKDDAYELNEDTTLTVPASTGVLQNDTDADSGDTLSVGTPRPVSGPTNGSLTLNENGSFTYTPNADYNGPDSFTYRANDGTVDSGSVATVNITVNPVNDAPVATNGTASMAEDAAPITINFADLVSDIETANANLTYNVSIASADAGKGTLSGSGSTRAFDSAENFNGAVTIYYKVTDTGDPDDCTGAPSASCDAPKDSETKTVTVTVRPVNDAPVANNATESMDEDAAPITIDFGALVSDIETSDANLTYNIITGPTPAQGTLSGMGSTRTFDPADNFNGSVEITYTVTDRGDPDNCGTADEDCDAPKTSTQGKVTVTVNAVNDAPTLAVSGGACLSNTAASGRVDFTVADLDDAAASLTLSASSSNTSLIPNSNLVAGGSGADRTLTLKATPRKRGRADLTVSVSDGADTSTLPVTVRVGTQAENMFTGTGDANVIFGLGGRDTLTGGGGRDLLCGGEGKDLIRGQSGADVLDGGRGGDRLNGRAGGDLLFGRAGGDTLTGAGGADFFSGGAGVDTATDFDATEGDTRTNIP